MSTHLPQKLAYVSVDTENDAASPFDGSMIEIGVSARDADTGEEVLAFSSPVRRREGRAGDAATLQWLREQNLYERLIAQSSQNPEARTVLADLGARLQTLVDIGYKFEWVARPAAYDWMWLWTYWCEYGPEKQRSLVPFKCTCLSTLFNLWLMQQSITDQAVKEIEWSVLAEDAKHTHVALDDAREQGTAHFNLIQRFKSLAAWDTSMRERSDAKRAKRDSKE